MGSTLTLEHCQWGEGMIHIPDLSVMESDVVESIDHLLTISEQQKPGAKPTRPSPLVVTRQMTLPPAVEMSE